MAGREVVRSGQNLDGVNRCLKGLDVEYEGKMEAEGHAKVFDLTILAMEIGVGGQDCG